MKFGSIWMNFRAGPIKFGSPGHFQSADRMKFASSRSEFLAGHQSRRTDRQKFSWARTEFDRPPVNGSSGGEKILGVLTEFLVTA
jgi:hypothetical protein